MDEIGLKIALAVPAGLCLWGIAGIVGTMWRWVRIWRRRRAAWELWVRGPYWEVRPELRKWILAELYETEEEAISAAEHASSEAMLDAHVKQGRDALPN